MFMSFFDSLLSGVWSLIEDSASRLSHDRSLSSSQRSEFASTARQAREAQRTIRNRSDDDD